VKEVKIVTETYVDGVKAKSITETYVPKNVEGAKYELTYDEIRLHILGVIEDKRLDVPEVISRLRRLNKHFNTIGDLVLAVKVVNAVKGGAVMGDWKLDAHAVSAQGYTEVTYIHKDRI